MFSVHGGGLGMAFDQSKIGTLAAELMEELESRFTDDARIGDLALVVEVVSPARTEIATTYSNTRAHVNLGLLDLARESILRTGGNRGSK